MTRTRFALLIFMVLFIGVVACQKPEPAEDLSPLDRTFQAALDSLGQADGYPGATAAYVRADGTFGTFATGVADAKTGLRMTPETRMLAGSVGKTFVAAVALALEREGVLSIADQASKWLGNEPWFGRVPNRKSLTLRMLLTHSSGLEDHVRTTAFAGAVRAYMEKTDRDPDFYFKPQELVAFVLDKPPLFAPGEGYSYSDTNYILAGLIIEKASGRTYYDLLRERFLVPLKLEHTVPADRRQIPKLANGHLERSNPLGLPDMLGVRGELSLNPLTEWTGGGLASTSGDLAKWTHALFSGKAMDGPYLDALLDGVPREPGGSNLYGLGVYINRHGGAITYGHGGWFPGFRTLVQYDPATGTAIAMQVNRDYDLNMSRSVALLAEIVGR